MEFFLPIKLCFLFDMNVFNLFILVVPFQLQKDPNS